MKKTFNTLNIVTTAMLCALGVILASTFHHLAGQSVATLFCAMHLPVFLAGILCGPWLGLICGGLTPIVSFMSSGRPPFPNGLIPMVIELLIYGFLSGMLRYVFLKNPKTNKFSSVLALVISMVAGRVVSAFVSAIFTTLSTPDSAYFIVLGQSLLHKFTTTWAGILVQLVLIPAILFALQRSGVLIKYLPAGFTAMQPAAQTDNEAEESN